MPTDRALPGGDPRRNCARASRALHFAQAGPYARRMWRVLVVMLPNPGARCRE